MGPGTTTYNNNIIGTGHNKVSPQSTDQGLLYSVNSKVHNVNKCFCPETLCLYSAACCTYCTEELDQKTDTDTDIDIDIDIDINIDIVIHIEGHQH